MGTTRLQPSGASSLCLYTKHCLLTKSCTYRALPAKGRCGFPMGFPSPLGDVFSNFTEEPCGLTWWLHLFCFCISWGLPCQTLAMSPQWPCFYRWWKHETLVHRIGFLQKKKNTASFSKKGWVTSSPSFPASPSHFWLIGSLRCSLSVPIVLRTAKNCWKCVLFFGMTIFLLASLIWYFQ